MQMQKIIRLRNKNKRAAITDLFVFIISIFSLMLFIGIIVYISTNFYSSINEQFNTTEHNYTAEMKTMLKPAIDSYSVLKWGATLIIIGMLISILVSGYLIRINPAFFLAYIFVIIIAVIVAVPIANTYEIIRTETVLNSTLSEYTAPNVIISHLPLWVGLTGFVGAVIMYAKRLREEE